MFPISLGLLLILIPVVLYSLYHSDSASAAWYNDSWSHRKAIIITYTGSTTLTDFQVELDEVDVDGLNTAGKLQADCDDLRFTDTGGRLLDYWIEDENNSADTIDCSASDYDIWVKVPSIDEDTTIYMYYGNPSADAYSSGEKTFEFFDAFSVGSTPNAFKWAYQEDAPSVGSGNLSLLATDDATDLEGIASADTFGDASPGDNDVEVVTMRASQNNTAALGRLGFSNTATITTSYTTDDSAAMFFDATTGGNHETETANGGTTQSSTAAVAEDTSYHQYDITIGASNAVLSVDGTSATHSTQYPNSAQYVRLETTDITNTFSVDHVFTRKLATTTPTVPAYGSYEAEEASPGPVAYWKFDEGVDNTCSGGTNDACDATGHGIDLSKTNATWRTEDECISGKCLRFEFDIPTQQYLTRTDDDQLDFDANTDFTLSGWFRHTSTPAGADNIITKRNTGIGYEVRMENLGYISFTIDNGSNSDIATSTANYADSKWHHFSAVKNGTTSINLYIDGVEVASDTSIAATGTLENSDDFYIGLDGDGAGGQWEGFLDEIKVYRYARSEAEIKSDYNQSYAAAFGPDNSWLSDGLIGYWKMDELSGNATDLSGNGTTLTNTGTTTFTGAKFGNGSEHNGSSQYFDVVDNAYLSVTGSLTLSAWINPDDTTGSQDIHWQMGWCQ